MAHRLVKPVAAVARRHEQLAEEIVDFAANPLGLGVELEPRAGRPSQPASNGVTPGRPAVGAEGNLLDPLLRRLEPRLAMTAKPVAFLVELDRLVERRLALFKQANDLLEPGKRCFEAQLRRRRSGRCPIVESFEAFKADL